MGLSEPDTTEVYAVPVYSFDSETAPEDPHTANDDTDETVRVTYADSQIGDPVLRAAHTTTNTTERYRFRITDTDLHWCGYKGDTPQNLPIPVQHAVNAFGYAIDGLDSPDPLFLDWLEAQRITETLIELIESFDDLVLYEKAIRDAIGPHQAVSAMLLARYALSDDEYWSEWDDYENDVGAAPDQTVSLQAIRERLWVKAIDTDVAKGLTHDGNQTINMITDVTTKTGDAGEYLQVSFLTEFGIKRFQFQTTGSDRCVLQKPRSTRVPPAVVVTVNENGYTITNIESIEQCDSPLEILEYVPLFVNSLREIALVPERFDETPLDIENVSHNASLAGMCLKLLELNEPAVRKVHTLLLEARFGHTNIDELTKAGFDELLLGLYESIPDEMAAELGNYIEDHPAHEEPGWDRDSVSGSSFFE